MTLAADDVTDKSSAAFTRVVAVDTHRVIGLGDSQRTDKES